MTIYKISTAKRNKTKLIRLNQSWFIPEAGNRVTILELMALQRIEIIIIMGFCEQKGRENVYGHANSNILHTDIRHSISNNKVIKV